MVLGGFNEIRGFIANFFPPPKGKKFSRIQNPPPSVIPEIDLSVAMDCLHIKLST